MAEVTLDLCPIHSYFGSMCSRLFLAAGLRRPLDRILARVLDIQVVSVTSIASEPGWLYAVRNNPEYRDV